MSLLELKGITRSYKNGQIQVNALNGIDLKIEDGDFVSIMGPSGSGKSTLLNIIGCLDLPTSGTYMIRDKHVEKLRDGQLADIRNQFIGFVFQRFHLLPNLSALENVELPLIYQGILGKKRKKIAKEALEAVGLGDRMNHLPSQLSGGEQQRVAIARAISSNPSLILADEPTGALDSRTSETIMNIFQKLNRELKITIVQVTHERKIALYGHKIYHLLDGNIEKVEILDKSTVKSV
ncbi:putative ABC transport system ATP-binding protein [Caloranaerobacter azorensis DSM 13643]|uniref:Putative ABC transport system ATP-binding protein n=1 Tax=Caloranaerobacter azorensis DSM 13643 TaxID=1121264 RepID=A0A1M5VDD0_9FIRM|nr:ABC transporter ATP-binding protein [Caloranaerobacter azorensis]SHH73158.1 putative ABC transport system ATP-binding protein [Caloranaerobacter azorensis DSM 13643]